MKKRAGCYFVRESEHSCTAGGAAQKCSRVPQVLVVSQAVDNEREKAEMPSFFVAEKVFNMFC